MDRARRCEAERVGLTYPPPPQKRKAGKPSVQAKLEEALLRHIRVHTLLPENVDRTVRVGWRPGCPLVLPDGAVSLPPRHKSEEIIRRTGRQEGEACQDQCTAGRHRLLFRLRGQHESSVWLVSSALISLVARHQRSQSQRRPPQSSKFRGSVKDRGSVC